MGMTQRQQEIVKILSRENDYVTVDAIASALHVSKRTIHNDLNSLIENVTPFRIEKKPGAGIRIVWLNNQENQPMVSETKNRILHIFHTLLFKAARVTYQSLAEELYVSTTSIMQDLNQIRHLYLNDATVSLQSDVHGTRFVGDEAQIQKTMLIFNDLIAKAQGYHSEDVTYLYPYYGQELVDACLEIIHALEQYNLYNIAKHYEMNVFNELVVMSYRLRQGKHLKIVHNALKVDEVMAMKHYLIAKDLLEMLAQKLDFEFEEPDVYALSMYLQANRLEFHPSQNHIDSRYASSARRMIDRMSVCVGVALDEDEVLYQNILVHLYHMVYRMQNGIYIRNPLLSEIKEEFRLMFDLTWLVVEDEKKILNIEISEDEIGFLMLHFQHALDKVMKSRRVLVVCPNGVVSSGFIVNRIRKILPPLDIVEAVSFAGVTRFDLESVDLIISTIPLADVEKPIVVVSPLISDKDLEAINKVYQEHLAYHDKEGEISFSSLAPYLDKELIFVDQDADHFETILETVSERLLALDYVEAGYQESLFEREANGGTEIATGAAVPHGSMDLVKQTVLPIWINKHPVKWGKYHVKVVIFFTLTRNDLGYAKKLLEDIFKLVKSKKFMDNQLSKLNKEEVFILLSGGKDFD